jgi:hypothetical protein
VPNSVGTVVPYCPEVGGAEISGSSDRAKSSSDAAGGKGTVEAPTYGQWTKNMESDERQWEQGDRCVYGRWAIDVTSPPVASEIMGIRTLNRGVVIPFFSYFFNEG